MPKKPYYGVCGGPSPGVYLSWDEARQVGQNVPGASVKKFATKAEAEAYAAPKRGPMATSLGGGDSGDGGGSSSGDASSSTYLDCPFSEKDAAKALGAKWDGARKAWYVPAGVPLAPFARWLPSGQSGGAPAQAAPPAAVAVGGKRSRSAQEAGAAEAGAEAGSSGSAASEEELLLYTDGSCPSNQNVATSNLPAGWGVVVVRGGAIAAERYGPVVIDPADPTYLGAEVCSNNTGELSALCEALLFLRDEATPAGRATVRYDSKYAANIASGAFKAHKNKALAATARSLYSEVVGSWQLRLEHVKGHSGEKWNEKADELANKGAAGARSAEGRWKK